MIVPYLSFLVSLHATNDDVHTHMYVVRAALELTYLFSCHDVSMFGALAEVGCNFTDVRGWCQ